MNSIVVASDKKYSRNDRDGAMTWIKGALDVIAHNGIDELKISRLAKEVGVSKGSFYWFFEDLPDLLQCCLQHWKEDLNEIVFDSVSELDASPRERLFFLVEAVFDSKLGRYDAAIRAWGLKDDNAKSVILEVDARRLNFLIALFLQTGMQEALAKRQAHLLYRAIIAESYLSEYPDDMKGVDYLKDLISKFLTGSNQRSTTPISSRNDSAGIRDELGG